MRRASLIAVVLLLAGIVASACAATSGAAGGSSARVSVPSGNWTTFDYNRQRSGVGPSETGITSANAHTLKTQTIKLDGTVDASVVELASVKIDGRDHTTIFFTTDYGQTEAYDAASGKRLWQFTPPGFRSVNGSSQVTTATPLIDPTHRYLYAASPTGYIFKLNISDGKRLWSRRVTYDPGREKIAGALNFSGSKYLLTETDGYSGDTPTYQGHVVLIDKRSGKIAYVWNSLCSNIHHLIDPPSKCSASDSAIWGRPGAVVEPWNGNILVTTGNGPFNGHTDWGDSVLQLSPRLKLLSNWTPTNQQQLNDDDWDLGSTEPALLPARHGVHLAVQGGKEGILHLLNVGRLDGTAGKAGPRTGGELQAINAPGPTDVFSQPSVLTVHGKTYVFVTDSAGTEAYRYNAKNRLQEAWKNTNAGTSPVVAGGLLYIYNENAGDLYVMNPLTGHIDATLPAAGGHWNSPVVVGGRVFLPVGNDNNHDTSGQLLIYHLPSVR
jgi:outer membrane protein assembly factor BamB